MSWGIPRTFPFNLNFKLNFNFIVYFSKHQNVPEYFVTEQKAVLSLKITLETRYLYKGFTFLMFNKSKCQENR